jgi:hypothetical protein
MKKLLVALLAISCTVAFADTTVIKTTDDNKSTHKAENNGPFNNNDMKCKNHKLTDGIKASQLKKECKMEPNQSGDDKNTIRFTDENSGKHVKCETDQHGKVTVAKCMSVD